MAEEKIDYNEKFNGTDDMNVLRELLHSIRGLSPVSGGMFVPIEEAVDDN